MDFSVPKTVLEKAKELEEKGESAKAADLLREQASILDRSGLPNPDLWHELARLYEEMGEIAFSRDASLAAAHAELKIGKSLKAVARLKKLIEVDPIFIPAYELLIKILRLGNELEHAEIYEKQLQSIKDEECLRGLVSKLIKETNEGNNKAGDLLRDVGNKISTFLQTI